MAIEFEHSELTELTPKIAVIGVGGAGCNAVNNMIAANLRGVDFVIANTDAQSLLSVPANTRIQLGREITQGLGAGAQPKVGEAAAEESLNAIEAALEGAHMAFITAGMGGGTGTGASPVVARQAREKGILTVGVVTKPFQFEGGRRMKIADAGIKELAAQVDTLIIIPNQNLFNVANERTTFAEAFQLADDVLHSGVRSITDLMVEPGLINLDFADVRTVMSEMGKAMMGTGEADGENRAREAAERAISNQLLEDASLKGARGVIINVTGGLDMTLYEVDEAVNLVRDLADEDALIVFGSAYSESMEGRIRVSVVATGIEGGPAPARKAPVEMPRSENEASAEMSNNAAAPAPADAVAVLESEQLSLQPETESASAEEEREETVSDDVLALEAVALEMQGEAPTLDAPMTPPQELLTAGEEAEDLPAADSAAEADYADEVQNIDAPAPVEVAQEPAQPSFFQKVTRRFATEEQVVNIADKLEERASNDAGEKSEGEVKSGSIGGVTSEDRAAPTREARQQMEIPAFLKRQQN